MKIVYVPSRYDKKERTLFTSIGTYFIYKIIPLF